MFFSDKRKIGIIGCGSVGMSYAFALLTSGVCNELVLIDRDHKRIKGEAKDLNHGLAYSPEKMTVYAGDYDDLFDADLAVICAGGPHHKGETRLDLSQRNTDILCDVVPRIIDSGFNGIYIVVTNPVDVMTRVTLELSGAAPEKVIGSGTTLDSARLRFLCGRYFGIDPRNVHAYVVGEHGDSEFVLWSSAMIATKTVNEIISESKGKYYIEDMISIEDEVRRAAYSIIEAKGSTCYGIAMALIRLTKAIYGDENSVLTLSSYLQGEYGQEDVYIGSPCIVNRDGIVGHVRLNMTEEEKEKFDASCDLLRRTYEGLHLTEIK